MRKGTLKQILRCLMAALMILAMVGCQSDGAGETEPSATGEQLQITDTTPESTAADETDPSEVLLVPVETTKAAEPDETKPTGTNPVVVDPPATEPKQTTPPHTHSYSAGNTVAATCTGNGYTVYTCSCGASYNDNTVSATGHNWSSWTTTKEATTTEEGRKARTCSSCKETEWETLPKVPGHVHDYYATVTVATCTTEGFTLHVCKTCPSSSEGALYKTNQVPALGHNFAGGVCTRCGGYESGELNYAAAEAYGNQYAVDTYGWYIDLELNADNAGYYPASTGSIQGFVDRGGQSYLNKRVADKIDALHSNLSNRGINKAYINCDVYDNGEGRIYILVYYG